MKPKTEQRNKWHMERVVTFDIEAYDWVKPVSLGMYTGDDYTDFMGDDCVSQFMNEVMRRKYRNTRFVAHNGGNYDFGFIITYAIENDLDYYFLEKGNSVFYIQIYDENGKPRYFQDSLELLMSSLGKLAPEFSSYEKLDFDLDKIAPIDDMKPEHIHEMRDYLEVDCKALYECLEEFTRVIYELSDGNCSPQLTMGSTTMSMYRTQFQEEAIPQSFNPIPDNTYDEMVSAYETSNEYDIRKSYFGGRTEVYKMYGEDLNHYDVNSLFPYVYTRKKMPVGNPKRFNDASRDVLDMTGNGGVAKITGYVPDVHIPVLPVRHTADDYEKVIFPTGKIEGWYTLAELRYAESVGAVEDLQVHEAIVSRYGRPFKEYGETLYDLKKTIDSENEPAKYWVVKLLLNSFYGKFALDRKQENILKVDNPLSYITENDTKLIPINETLEDKGVFKEPDMSKAEYIIPRIATEITAKARIEMHKWFTKAGVDNVWYCDTDSIVTDSTLPTGDDLGELDLENNVEKGYFLAPKVYAELTPEGKSRTKAKGMRDNPNPFMAFEKAFEDNLPELISAKWESPKGVLTAIKEDGKMTVDEQSRTLKQFDNKRVHSGNTSKPIELSE